MDRSSEQTFGLWPRAVVLLQRQALEVALKTYWSLKAPGVEECSARAQLLCLGTYLTNESVARRAHQTWTALSRALPPPRAAADARGACRVARFGDGIDRCHGGGLAVSTMDFDSESAAFLLLLQRDLYGPSEADREAESEALRILATQIPDDERTAAAKAVTLADVPVPTPYESPVAYSLLTEIADGLVAALEEDVRFPNQPLVGTLPLGWPTALLLRVPNSTKHVAVVDRSFTVFANLLAKACAQGLMPVQDDDSIEAWKAGLESGSHKGVQRYVELIAAMLQGEPSSAPAYWPDAAWSPIAVQLRCAIESFVIGDPFIHVALGHAQATPVRPGGIHARAETYEWTESQRAEAFVLRLAATASVLDRRGYDQALGYWGIEMYLRTRVFLEASTEDRRVHAYASGERAEEGLASFRPVLAGITGERSRAIAMLTRFDPVADAFLTQAGLALSDDAGGVH
jgi:hypothetical protein